MLIGVMLMVVSCEKENIIENTKLSTELSDKQLEYVANGSSLILECLSSAQGKNEKSVFDIKDEIDQSVGIYTLNSNFSVEKFMSYKKVNDVSYKSGNENIVFAGFSVKAQSYLTRISSFANLSDEEFNILKGDFEKDEDSNFLSFFLRNKLLIIEGELGKDIEISDKEYRLILATLSLFKSTINESIRFLTNSIETNDSESLKWGWGKKVWKKVRKTVTKVVKNYTYITTRAIIGAATGATFLKGEPLFGAIVGGTLGFGYGIYCTTFEYNFDPPYVMDLNRPWYSC